MEARETGDMTKMEPNLAAYYSALRYITTAPLFDWQRIKTIVLFNLGGYEEHRMKYLETR